MSLLFKLNNSFVNFLYNLHLTCSHNFFSIYSIKSIVCLNLPCFLGEVDPWERSNVKKKRERKFTPSFVDDGLLEVIGFKDSWHGLKNDSIILS
ncbi:unnamed protein product, partial [Vitis vinifera]|uniref:Diacylglycerol kinase accessory domain-containing protein n=1 Tax=Vitis vinifera TaxID=29760 RepID=D7TU63_VITVI